MSGRQQAESFFWDWSWTLSVGNPSRRTIQTNVRSPLHWPLVTQRLNTGLHRWFTTQMDIILVTREVLLDAPSHRPTYGATFMLFQMSRSFAIWPRVLPIPAWILVSQHIVFLGHRHRLLSSNKTKSGRPASFRKSLTCWQDGPMHDSVSYWTLFPIIHSTLLFSLSVIYQNRPGI